MKVVISGTGLFTPPEKISNAELVASFNAYVHRDNELHQKEIAAGTREALLESSEDFIVKASGIKNRHVINKSGILDINIMCPIIPERGDEEIAIQAEVAVIAAKQALQNANRTAAEIDAVICSCTNLQRAYPSISIEVQKALGIKGFGYDMSMACSSVTFGIQAATTAITSGQAKCVLLINPEIITPQVNFRDRESHFIFGDVATAMIIERAEDCEADHAFEVIDIKLQTEFSNNVRCNFGFINRSEHAAGAPLRDKLFTQQGRKVFKEVVNLVVALINGHLNQCRLKPSEFKRLWLHQANSNMDRLIATKILGYEPPETLMPVILDEYANTGSGGIAIAFHEYHRDLNVGDLGLMCSFGAGYSIGNVILRKII